jgi:hypothetical protein
MAKHEHDSAQVCLNGHVLNPAVHVTPQYNSDHCPKCGAETVTACDCGEPIRGALVYVQKYSQSVLGGLRRDDPPPAYCTNCGSHTHGRAQRSMPPARWPQTCCH